MNPILHAFLPVVTAYYLKRHGGIWGLKRLIFGRDDRPLAQHAYYYYLARYGSWIGHNSRLAGPVCFPHGMFGIFISSQAVIGRNCTLFQQVTIGSNTLRGTRRPGSPVVGDNVLVGAGAKVIGHVRVGDNSRIGANAVVYDDVPPHSVVVLGATRVIQKANLDNRHFVRRGGRWFSFQDGEWKLETDEQAGDLIAGEDEVGV